MKRRIYIGNFKKHLDKKKNHRVVFKKAHVLCPKSTRPFLKRTRAFSEV